MTQVKKETAKEVQPKVTTQEPKDVTAKPETTADVKPEPTPVVDETPAPVVEPEKVTESGIEKITVGGEEILNGGKDALEGDPTEGIDEKAAGAKDQLDTQKKAEEAIHDGTSGLDPIAMAEVQNGLVKDYNSDRPVYETASAAMSALSASGKLATDKKK